MSTIPNNSTTTGTGTANAGSSNTAQATAGLNSNYQDFLKMLTTQLQNQDPTAPADTNQITQQIATLSQVEQQINTNSLLQQLVSMMGAGQTNTAVSYIGKQIDATGNQVELSGSQAALVYNLPAGATKATVTITNAAGQTVFSGDGTTIAGRNQVLWNGVNSTTGQTVADGAYNFSVAATDSSGKAVTATTFTTGTVVAVDTESGVSSLSLGGGVSVPISAVQSIYTAGTNPGA